MTGLSPGPIYDLVADTVYALPGRACRLHVQVQTATSIDLSNESDMSEPQVMLAADWQTAGAYETGVNVAGGFIESVGGTARVRLLPY
jgi:hypothetical protein